MTEMMKGKDPANARGRIRTFVALVNGGTDHGRHGPTRDQRAVLDTIRKFPSRARCVAANPM